MSRLLRQYMSEGVFENEKLIKSIFLRAFLIFNKIVSYIIHSKPKINLNSNNSYSFFDTTLYLDNRNSPISTFNVEFMKRYENAIGAFVPTSR